MCLSARVNSSPLLLIRISDCHERHPVSCPTKKRYGGPRTCRAGDAGTWKACGRTPGFQESHIGIHRPEWERSRGLHGPQRTDALVGPAVIYFSWDSMCVGVCGGYVGMKESNTHENRVTESMDLMCALDLYPRRDSSPHVWVCVQRRDNVASSQTNCVGIDHVTNVFSQLWSRGFY